MDQLISRLEVLVIENHTLKENVSSLASRILERDAEIVLLKASHKIAEAAFQSQLDKLHEDVREARCIAQKLRFNKTKTLPPPMDGCGAKNHTNVIGTPQKTDVAKYSSHGPLFSEERWTEIAKMIVKDVSVPESERHTAKQTIRLKKMLGNPKVNVRELHQLIKDTRKSFGMSETGPSIPDLTRTPIPLPPPSCGDECNVFGFLGIPPDHED